MFPFNRSDFLKLIDHGATWWRHWSADELKQFNRRGPLIKVNSRSFRIHHERSDEPNKLFPRPGLNGHILVQERLRSRSWNNFCGRGAASDEHFRAAVDAHIANQTGWLEKVEAELVAEDVKSVVEHADIYRVYHVWLPGGGMPSKKNPPENGP